MKPPRKFPRLMVLRVQGQSDFSLTIDGEEFPYVLSRDMSLAPGPVATGFIPTLTITLMAERLEVVHDLDGPGDAVEAV